LASRRFGWWWLPVYSKGWGVARKRA